MTETASRKIIFVYNADSGVFNLVSDIAHKIFSPQTYACNLCALTHSNFGMRGEWKEYLGSLRNPLEFLHADEFKKKYPSAEVELPAVFVEENAAPKEIVSARQINESRSMADLKVLINEGLKG